MKKRLVLILVLSCVFSSTAFSSPIQLVENGSFEANAVPPNSFSSLFPVVTGWNGIPLLLNGNPGMDPSFLEQISFRHKSSFKVDNFNF